MNLVRIGPRLDMFVRCVMASVVELRYLQGNRIDGERNLPTGQYVGIVLSQQNQIVYYFPS